jgi:hypothetical protein
MTTLNKHHTRVPLDLLNAFLFYLIEHFTKWIEQRVSVVSVVSVCLRALNLLLLAMARTPKTTVRVLLLLLCGFQNLFVFQHRETTSD